MLRSRARNRIDPGQEPYTRHHVAEYGEVDDQDLRRRGPNAISDRRSYFAEGTSPAHRSADARRT